MRLAPPAVRCRAVVFLDEMQAAIVGSFARVRQRRGSVFADAFGRRTRR